MGRGMRGIERYDDRSGPWRLSIRPSNSQKAFLLPYHPTIDQPTADLFSIDHRDRHKRKRGGTGLWGMLATCGASLLTSKCEVASPLPFRPAVQAPYKQQLPSPFRTWRAKVSVEWDEGRGRLSLCVHAWFICVCPFWPSHVPSVL